MDSEQQEVTVLALDPGLSTGWAIVRGTEKDLDMALIAQGCVRIPEGLPLYPDGILFLENALMPVIDRYRPQSVIVEMPPPDSKFVPEFIGTAFLVLLRRSRIATTVAPAAKTGYETYAQRLVPRHLTKETRPHITDAVTHAVAFIGRLFGKRAVHKAAS